MAKNHTDKPTKPLTPSMIKIKKDARGRNIITLPGPDYDSPQPLGDIIAQAQGRPLDGGPLNVIGG